jgi:trans-L-3-hydroxyproline dehydratase
MIYRIQTIDAHAAGEPLRLVTGGFPTPVGETMLEKRDWVREHCDGLRRALMHEPRGHADMYGAVLTEPCTETAHAGVLFMHNEGYSTMCGHGVIAVCTIALERGLIGVAGESRTVVLESPAGLVRARVTGTPPEGRSPEATGLRIRGVAFENVPSFVLRAGLPVSIGNRVIPVDVAFGGAFYAIVDSEAVGIPLRHEALGRLRQAGIEIARAVEAALRVVHPTEPGISGVYGTVFTGMAERVEADLRNVTVFAGKQIDRSPCGTGTAAVMAVLDAMGLLASDHPFVHESIVGTLFRGVVRRRTLVGDLEAIVPEIEGSAWITGEHLFLIDDDDPFKEGFVL